MEDIMHLLSLSDISRRHVQIGVDSAIVQQFCTRQGSMSMCFGLQSSAHFAEVNVGIDFATTMQLMPTPGVKEVVQTCA